MKLLFVTDSQVNPIQGGTERITYTLSREFFRRGIPCHLAYYKSVERPAEFSGRIQLTSGAETEELHNYIIDNAIDAIIVNLITIECKRSFYPAVTQARKGTDCKVFACFHAMAGEELLGNSPSCSLWRILHGKQSAADGFKDIALRIAPKSIVKAVCHNYIQKKYRLLLDNCDTLVMLSSRDFANFAELAGTKPGDKFTAIGSALSFQEFLKPMELANKQKEVMILSRMDERSKRISEALKIWSKAKLPDWKLVIVGGGPDLEYFQKMACRMGLENIEFKGRQPDAIPYYKRASIFMLTSSYEGWCLTLTEAQQMGTVPIAYDSYPALGEIISNGRDGIMVPDRDRDAFVEKLRELMLNRNLREKMALAGLESCKRHSVENVVDQWIKLLEKK